MLEKVMVMVEVRKGWNVEFGQGVDLDKASYTLVFSRFNWILGGSQMLFWVMNGSHSDLVQDRPLPPQISQESTLFLGGQSKIDGHQKIQRSVVKQH